MSQSEPVAVSAPGKVLLSGGYLVTRRDYTGLVFGLDARIHAIVQEQNDENRTTDGGLNVLVRSPQFTETQWDYSCALSAESRGYRIIQRNNGPQNMFVEAVLCYVLSYLSINLQPTSIDVSILADESYYSQAHTATACPHNTQSRFVDFNVALQDAHKTGLGSSAALVTALTGALLRYFSPVEDASADGLKRWRNITHNLAQAAHCSAQGKIGSGFDVAAAVWGSCMYRRFSPSILEEIGDRHSVNFAKRLAQVINDIDERGKARTPPGWDMEILETASMPQGLRLVLCDIDQGTSTPGMVQKVMAWRQAQPEAANAIWERLQKGTVQLEQELRQMVQHPEKDSTSLRCVIEEIRKGVRDMSEAAAVPIEPTEQTALLDGIIKACPFVVGGVVPGAGGYDALALLIEDSEAAMRKLGQYYTEYMQQWPERQARSLRTREDMEGVKGEVLELYQGWIPLNGSAASHAL